MDFRRLWSGRVRDNDSAEIARGPEDLVNSGPVFLI